MIMIRERKKERKKEFPNLPLMKLSAYHKSLGDDVEWYDGAYCDLVYVSKVFTFTEDYKREINAGNVIYGGSGYAIKCVEGVEVYDPEADLKLPYEIEHIYPDYDLYGIKDTAYGFIQRGCPRNCQFCHVGKMQGLTPHIVSSLDEFWRGQKNIVLLDPNITALKEWKQVFQQLIDSGATVDFSQGLDIRLMTDEKAEMLKRMKIKMVHFAFDRYEDYEHVVPKLKRFKEITGWGRSKVMVYILVNHTSSFEQDLERVELVRQLNFQPYIMRYDKEHIPKGSRLNALARWCNFIPLFWKYRTFDEYVRNERKKVLN